MIIISAGFMKSASTLLHDYQTEIIKISKNRSGQKALEHFSSGIGTAYRGNLDLKTFLLLIYVNFRYGDVVLKTHGEPSIYVRLLVDWGLAKITYSYRDPRDVALSMVDHGAKTREKLLSAGESLQGSKGFRQVYTVNDAIPLIQKEIEVWYKWKAFGDAFYVEYRSFIQNKFEYLNSIVDYLDFSLSESDLNNIFEKYENTKSRNFNKGKGERFRTEMKEEDINLLNKNFEQDLSAMGYKP